MRKMLSLAISLLLLCSCLCPACLAEDTPYDESFEGVTVDSMETYLTVLDNVSFAAFHAGEWPIRDIKSGESHTAILFEDGTVTAFQSFGWYGCAHDFDECDTSEWENVSAIACGAEVTYGLKEDGSIVYAGEPHYLGFDYGYCESGTLPKTLAARGYVDIVTSAYSPLFLLKKDGSIVVELDASDEMAEAIKEWKGVIDIELGKDGFYALQKDGTVHVLSDMGEYSGNVKTATGLKTVGMKTYVVLKNGTMKDVRSIIPELRENDLDYDYVEGYSEVMENEDAESVWRLGDAFGGATGYVYVTDDGETVALQQAEGSGMEYWTGLRELYSWNMYLPESYDDGYYNAGSASLLVMGVLEDGTCRLRSLALSDY